MQETVLLIDDFIIEREMLKEFLQDEYIIIEASNGREGLDVIEMCGNNIDIILLDLLMPDMDGFNFLEKRKESEFLSNIPVIVFTSCNGVEDQIRAFELSANDYITKPIQIGLIKSRMNNIVTSNKRMLSLLKNSEEYKAMAEKDLMTGIYNKVTTERMINDILSNSCGHQHAMLVFDIDDFKNINDTKGHQEGDRVIKEIASILSGAFRKSDIVGRIGGDEFLAFMNNIPSKDIAREKAYDLVSKMKYDYGKVTGNVSLSIGLAFSEQEDATFNSLFEKTDKALYEVKKSGKGRYFEFGNDTAGTEVSKKAVIITKSKETSANIDSMCHPYMETLTFADISGIASCKEDIMNKCAVLFVDFCNEDNITEDIEEIVNERNLNVIAICDEGNLSQYKKALNHPIVRDIVTAPLNKERIKRIVMQLEKPVNL